MNSILNKKQKNHLRSLSHQKVCPVLILGQGGLSDAFIAEADSTLKNHELIKCKMNVDDRSERKQYMAALCDALSAQTVQIIGKTCLLYRRNIKKAIIALPH